jgi:predicted AAA+ superfamily ATPase
MNDAEMHRQLSRNCRWWREPQGWERDDSDLKRLRDSPLSYDAGALTDIRADGLYVLRGPRRVGKSVDVKKTIVGLLQRGVQPRQIIHFACDSLKARELRQLERVGRQQATVGAPEPRYWFLDEITSVAGWPAEIKWLRDNSDLGQDCVVLTGSSSSDLDEARNELAGRRGAAARSDRLLLPMPFRTFCAQMRAGRALPDVPVIAAGEFLGSDSEAAIAEMLPWLDDLASLWEVYCRCGGFPPAVAGQLTAGDVEPAFVQAMFDVVHGDALRKSSFNTTQATRLMSEIAKGLSSFMNMSDLARDLGVADQRTAARRVRDLVDNYLCWPCHQRGQHGYPNLDAQSKYYFVDPVLARLAWLRDDHLPEPDTSAVSEQQIGTHLLRQAAAGDPGSYIDFSHLMCARNAARKEVDFLGPATRPLAFEGKYSDRGLERDSQTLESINGRGVLATRAHLGRSNRNDAISFLPASFVAYLLAD